VTCGAPTSGNSRGLCRLASAHSL